MYQESKSLLQVEKPAKESITKDLGLNTFYYPNALQVSTENLKMIMKVEDSLNSESK
jgi:hypothetical protein